MLKIEFSTPRCSLLDNTTEDRIGTDRIDRNAELIGTEKGRMNEDERQSEPESTSDCEMVRTCICNHSITIFLFQIYIYMYISINILSS